MKILIVDDLDDNREALERLVGRYSSKYNYECEILQACNGQEAVDLCQKQEVDLIFMDIVMPIMDGLEATREIKARGSKAMVIVVSSEDDEKLKVEMLQAGAEDYIIKPFSSAIMLNRLNNYQKIIASRESIGFQSEGINTFTNEIFSYHTRFYVTNDDELAQFWETVLVRLDYQKSVRHLSDFVRFLYRLGYFQLKKSYKFNIYIEEDMDNFYFSMDNMKLLSTKKILESIDTHYNFADYKLDGNIISFRLPRRTIVVEEVVTSEQNTSASASDHAPVPELAPVPRVKVEKEAIVLQTYEVLDETTLSEFERYTDKLKVEISLMGSSSLVIDDIDTMNEYIKQMSNLLSTSQDAFEIAESLRSFSQLLDESSEEFLTKSKELSNMVSSFINDIVTWKDMIFYTGAPSVDFLNNSISSSVEMIRAAFVEPSNADGDLDDIFDF